MNNGNGDLVGFRTLVWAWTTLFVFTWALAFWNRELGTLGTFDRGTAVFLTLFGVYLLRILKSQQEKIKNLEDKLLRFTTPSPFAHALPITNDE